jgi:hypothetical protein
LVPLEQEAASSSFLTQHHQLSSTARTAPAPWPEPDAAQLRKTATRAGTPSMMANVRVKNYQLPDSLATK